jgi:hypothetical protein
VLTDSAKLVDERKAAQYGVAFNADMTGQGGRISHDDLIPYHAIMGNVRVSHEEVPIPDSGQAMILYGTPMDRYVLTDHIVVANLQLCDFPPIFFVLGVLSDG